MTQPHTASLQPVNLAPTYPDLWRKQWFYPAVSQSRPIALIGIGDVKNYVKYNWADVGYRGFDCLYLHHNHNQTGVSCIFDVDQAAISVLQAYYGIRAVQHDICDSPLPNSYDWIFAADVIEHTRSPFLFLKHVAASLNPGGTGCVTTPNPDFWRHLIGHTTEDATHWQAISKHHFQNLARELCLDIVCLQTFMTASPFSADHKRWAYWFHRSVGSILGYNSLLFVFRNPGILKTESGARRRCDLTSRL